MINSLMGDIRCAWRSWRRQPGLAATAVCTLALGIAANTVIFSVVNAFFWRPLPYGADDGRLVMIETRRGAEREGVSYLDYRDWREANETFTDIAFFEPNLLANVSREGETETLSGAYVAAHLFEVLRAKPALGRTLLPEDDAPGAKATVLISHSLWAGEFGADTAIVGQSLKIDGRDHTIVGVMAPRFNFPLRAQLWLPAGDISRWYSSARRDLRYYQAVARVKERVTLAAAQAQISAVARRLQQLYPETNAGFDVKLTELREHGVGRIGAGFWLLIGACGCILLIACANITNLLFARAVARERETAVRMALGAGRLRIIRQAIIESLLVALAGGAGGALLAVWASDTVAALLPPEQLPAWVAIEVDGTVLLFTLLLSLFSAAASSLWPAVQASRPNLNLALNEGGRGAGTGLRGNRRRHALVVGEIALATALLIGAGLLLKSLLSLLNADPGFDRRGALVFELKRTYRAERTPEESARLYREVVERVERVPGVTAVGVNSDLPLKGQDVWDRVSVRAEGQSTEERRRNPQGNFQSVNRDYFRAMGIPLHSGRLFTADETQRADMSVAIISRELAWRLFGKEIDPLGKRLATGDEPDSPESWATVIGVVGDVRHHGLAGASAPAWYAPNYQRWVKVHLVVRVGVAPEGLAETVRKEVWSVSPDLGVARVTTLADLAADTVWAQRLWGVLLTGFAGLALLLAAAGVFGVMSYAVARRTHEIGIRIALGAQRGDVLRLVVGRGLLLAALGVALGSATALALTRLMSGLLYGVSATDPTTFAGVAALLVTVALLASYVPARRATRVDPLAALRQE